MNIGVAAHITAASPDGPRFDASLTQAERRSIENGIWLCQNCGKFVDNDEVAYPVGLLRQWKDLSEEAAKLEIETPLSGRLFFQPDEELIRFYAQCFDRPAFQDRFHQERQMEAFDKAIEDTITAINTGALRSRDGTVLQRSKGKSFLRDAKLRQEMNVIVDMLRAIRSRYALARTMGEIQVHVRPDGSEGHFMRDHELAAWMDRMRIEILSVFSNVAVSFGVPALDPISVRKRYW